MGMTMTEHPTCEICEAAPATLLKTDDEESWNEADGGHVVITLVKIKICKNCSEEWYDGTEAHPGTEPLA
jgi:YgiT-type zinc finger domain-containing protein